MARNYINPDLSKITLRRQTGQKRNRVTGVVETQIFDQHEIMAPDLDPDAPTGPYRLGYVGLKPNDPVMLIVYCSECEERDTIKAAVAVLKGGTPKHLAQIPKPVDPDEDPDEDEETETDDE